MGPNSRKDPVNISYSLSMPVQSLSLTLEAARSLGQRCTGVTVTKDRCIWGAGEVRASFPREVMEGRRGKGILGLGRTQWQKQSRKEQDS